MDVFRCNGYYINLNGLKYDYFLCFLFLFVLVFFKRGLFFDSYVMEYFFKF